MAVSEAVRLEREKRKTAREERLWQLVNDPNVKRLLLLSGIIAYSTYCARSKENVGPVQSALAFALPGIGLPLIAADAGVKDRWALAGISAAGIGYTTGQMIQGWGSAGVLPSAESILDRIKDLVNPLD
jgi:hypothetical protein